MVVVFRESSAMSVLGQPNMLILIHMPLAGIAEGNVQVGPAGQSEVTEKVGQNHSLCSVEQFYIIDEDLVLLVVIAPGWGGTGACSSS